MLLPRAGGVHAQQQPQPQQLQQPQQLRQQGNQPVHQQQHGLPEHVRTLFLRWFAALPESARAMVLQQAAQEQQQAAGAALALQLQLQQQQQQRAAHGLHLLQQQFNARVDQMQLCQLLTTGLGTSPAPLPQPPTMWQRLAW